MMNKTPQSGVLAILQQLKKEKKVGRNYHIYLPSTLLFGFLLYHKFRKLLKNQLPPQPFFSTVAKLTRVAEIQDEQGNQQGNVENVVVQPD